MSKIALCLIALPVIVLVCGCVGQSEHQMTLAELNACRSSQKACLAELGKNKTWLADSQKEQAAEQKAHAKKVKELDGEISDLQGKVAKLTQRNADSQARLLAAQSEIRKLKDDNKALDDVKKSLAGELKEQMKLAQNLQIELDKRLAQIEELQDQIKKASTTAPASSPAGEPATQER